MSNIGEIVREDKTLIVEALSVLSFLGISLELLLGFSSPDTRPMIFWLCTLSTIGISQVAAIILRNSHHIFRMVMTFLAGSMWTFLGCATINSITGVPILMIGAFNIYSFYVLSRRNSPRISRIITQQTL